MKIVDHPPVMHLSNPTAHDLRRLAVEAQCDPETIRRLFRGDPVRPSIAARIREAAERLDIRPARADAPPYELVPVPTVKL